MRAMLRELRGMQAALPLSPQRALTHELRTRFGPDPQAAADRIVVERARARGRIRSEREYRIVCAYADAIAGDPAAAPEHSALGALLDGYMAAP